MFSSSHSQKMEIYSRQEMYVQIDLAPLMNSLPAESY